MQRRWAYVVLSVLVAACGNNQSTMQCSNKVTPFAYQGVGYLDNGQALCTATLISTHVLLTAAHCVYQVQAQDVQFTLSPNPTSDPGVTYARGTQIVINPGYNPNDVNNSGLDVALVQLGSAGYEYGVTYFMPLGTDQSIQPGQILTSIGFGIDKNGQVSVETAKLVRFSSMQPDTGALGMTIPNGIVQVTRGPTGDIGCSGDSGSPLIATQGNGALTILGVYSTSQSSGNYDDNADCAVGIQDGEYIGVNAFAPWATGVAQQLEGSANQVSCQ
jgi:V8-like Glu-specific endopeptidase